MLQWEYVLTTSWNYAPIIMLLWPLAHIAHTLTLHFRGLGIFNLISLLWGNLQLWLLIALSFDSIMLNEAIVKLVRQFNNFTISPFHNFMDYLLMSGWCRASKRPTTLSISIKMRKLLRYQMGNGNSTDTGKDMRKVSGKVRKIGKLGQELNVH